MLGPLIPQGIIDPGWSFIIAMILGFFFGFSLESSGFSSSRKLVGLFYGYDFTVLKVFFTASIVAMLGLQYMNYLKLVDINMLFVLPTHVNAAVIGGLIMGMGFVTGGFCPGTSVCAASIGKIDAMVYVVGLFIGIFLFSEAYPLIEGIYDKGNWGSVTIYESLGIDKNIFILLFVIAAIVAFAIGDYVQKRVKKVDY